MIQIEAFIQHATFVPRTEVSWEIPELPTIGQLVFKVWLWQKTSSLVERMSKVVAHPKNVDIEAFYPSLIGLSRDERFCWLEQQRGSPRKVVLKIGDFGDCDLLNRDNLKETYVCRVWTRSFINHVRAGVVSFDNDHAIMSNGERVLITEHPCFEDIASMPHANHP